MSARLFSAISFSMVVHVLFWSGFFGNIPRTSDRSKTALFENSVFIDPGAMEAVRKAKAKARAAAEARAVQAASVKKKKAPPDPAPEPKPAAIPANPPAPGRTHVAEFAAAMAKAPEKAIKAAPAAENSAAPGRPAAVGAKTGADMMANPQTRGLFADYYGQVKTRIQEKLRAKCAGRNVGQGSVDLAFILLADGRLHKVYVMERSSSADSQLKQLAIESLRESAPFMDFPADFNARQIAFNLTVYFDDL